jgi:hypothetical protein
VSAGHGNRSAGAGADAELDRVSPPQSHPHSVAAGSATHSDNGVGHELEAQRLPKPRSLNGVCHELEVTAAAKKLQREVKDAMTDGVIILEDQSQINANKARLDAVKKAQDIAYIEMGKHSQGELDYAARVEAAAKKLNQKLQREVQDTMGHGVLPAAEQRQIDAKTKLAWFPPNRRRSPSQVAAEKAQERSSISSPGHGKPGSRLHKAPVTAPHGPSRHHTASRPDNKSKPRAKTRKGSEQSSEQRWASASPASSEQDPANVGSDKPGSARHRAMSTTTELVAQGLDEESASRAARLEVVPVLDVCVCQLVCATLPFFVHE